MKGAGGVLRQVLGDQALLCGYPLKDCRRWLAIDELEAQTFSAGSLCVAGDLPILCGHMAASSLALDLLAEAGWTPPDRLLVFGDAEDLLNRIHVQASGGSRLAASFPFPEARIHAGIHLVEPKLRALLNDKRSLEWLVPEGLRPARRVLDTGQVLREPASWRGSVLKVAGGESGGGQGVLLPPDSGDPGRVESILEGAEAVIVEEFLVFSSSRCFNYLIDGSGEARFLGAPEQALDGAHYLGNWFHREDRPAPAAVEAGMEICKRAAALGYRGAAGFDAGFLGDGSFRIVDLNFRMNGSTAPLLLVEDLLGRSDAGVALRTGFRGTAAPGVLASNLRRLIKEARFLPLSVVLSDLGAREREFLVTGFLLGPDRVHVQATAATMPRRLTEP